ncbi:MAG: hypothetical protein RLO22_27650, partial [Sneathiellaceae bacterium]
MRLVTEMPPSPEIEPVPGMPTDIRDMLGRIGKVRVLTVGDVMLDRFVYGAVSRVSYEAPIPVLNVERESAMPGGAGNAARNAAALGGRGPGRGRPEIHRSRPLRRCDPDQAEPPGNGGCLPPP